MSNIGKNIRKIRSVKNLNQTQFAELFDLKRASIGAYEEGRAEPKIATLSQIANYFGISVDDLLNKELSVNDLYHFDIFQKDYIKNKGNQLKPSKLPVSLSAVYYISQDKRSEYFEGKELSSFIKLNLPIPSLNSDYIAFESQAGSPWLNARGESLEMLICRKIEASDFKAFMGRSMLLWDGAKFYFGTSSEEGKSMLIRDFRHGEKVHIKPGQDQVFLALYELSNALQKV